MCPTWLTVGAPAKELGRKEFAKRGARERALLNADSGKARGSPLVGSHDLFCHISAFGRLLGRCLWQAHLSAPQSHHWGYRSEEEREERAPALLPKQGSRAGSGPGYRGQQPRGNILMVRWKVSLLIPQECDVICATVHTHALVFLSPGRIQAFTERHPWILIR